MSQHEDKEELRQAADQTKWADLDQADINDAVQACLATVKGRKLLWWLLEIGKINVQPFTLDPIQTSFNCGELNVGNQILARIVSVNPAGYVQLMQEKTSEYNSRLNASADGRSEPDASSGSPIADSGPEYL